MQELEQRLYGTIKHWLSRRFTRQVFLNVGTLVGVALMLFVYHTWAAPNPAPPAETSPASASTGLLSYQGYLTNATGEPLHGDRDITFRLYNVSTGGTALWAEAHAGVNAVPVEDGLFNVMLGSLTPIPNDVWSSGARYLGIQVAGDAEMSPREVVGSVPLAMTVPDGAITREKLGDPTLWRGLNDGAVIQSGSVEMSADETGITVAFDEEFAATPLVIITQVEASAGFANLIAHHITPSEFRVAKREGTACAVHWIAVGDVVGR